MICKNCSYNNTDGVDFCRHCGIPLKKNPPRPSKMVKHTAKREQARYEERSDFNDNPARNVNVVIPSSANEEEAQERAPRSGGAFKTATTAIGILMIICVIAFCIFVFDIIELPESGGSIAVDSTTSLSETPAPELSPSFTPVPTVNPET